jgi:adenine-specific DNA-methyltransferase
MPTTAQLRSRLVGKLKELFQLDQPDLDFGFYRIMHAKAQQVTEFLEKDLLKVIADTFGSQAENQNAAALTTARKELEDALGSDALDADGKLKEAFASLPAGKRYLEALAKAEAAKDALSAEGEIYDHLYRFFERYYEEGDFISRRYFSRETDGRAAPFAIPYNGEEVKLHWANADQYYIKTGEYFQNFTVDLAKAAEVVGKEEELGLENRDQPLLVHFRLVDAAEGEHGNVKASDATRRFFLLHEADPVGFNDKGELELRFEYRPDPDKPDKSQEGTWQEQRRSGAVTKLLTHLATLPQAAAYHRLLAAKAPTEANKDRTLLAKYLHQYTARNTADYFIHKDLGGFLRRDLDFYIKNEVMRLDDIEDDDAPRVETYLAKVKVLRRIARQLIAFLAQLEDFQKKLWLKKKFVVETNYGITLDRIPQELYPEIAANDAQRQEWVQLYAIDEIEGQPAGDLLQTAMPGYSEPLTVEFLQAQPHLVLDTRHFSEDFKARLIASIENFEDQCGGLLVHSENLQAMQCLNVRFKNTTKAVYVDPPYNTGEDGFNYKDGFQHSTWLSSLTQVAAASQPLISSSGVFLSSIDDTEFKNLWFVLGTVFGFDNYVGSYVWKRRSASGMSATPISLDHEYVLAFGRSRPHTKLHGLERRQADYPFFDEQKQQWYSSTDLTIGATKDERPNQFYPIINPRTGRQFEANPNRVWRFFPDTMRDVISQDLVIWPDEVEGSMERPRYKTYFDPNDVGSKPCSSWIETSSTNDREIEAAEAEYCSEILQSAMNQEGGRVLERLLGGKLFAYPKPVSLVRSFVRAATRDDDYVLDFFAGSGTTGHAVINLNREDNGRRKYILIEMGDHFDTVLKPRIAKVVYSPDWKDGKPPVRDKGISHCFKYLRLESYEDTLNNLRFRADPARDTALAANASLRRDYTLNYLLDVETRGSQSLLDIEAFTDPTAYTLKVKKPGATGSVERTVDLIETFHFLIGLRLVHLAAPQRFTASFKRVPDPDLPAGTDTRLQLDGRMTQSEDGPWWFRKSEGWVPKDRENPNNGQNEKVLIVWRTLTGNLEEDNLMLDEWFKKNCINPRETSSCDFDTIYVNGSNNLPNLKLDSDTWKVRLIEEEFFKAMWDVQDV